MQTILPQEKQRARVPFGMLAAVMLAAFVSPLVADINFQARKMTRGDVPLGKGQCDIRLRVDGEVEVSVRGDHVSVRTISGREARDDGSECNEPLPARPVSDFGYEVRDGRGEIALLTEPAARSRFSAVVRIRDGSGGEGRYHFRLSWRMDGGGPGFGGGFGGGGGRPGDNRPGYGNPGYGNNDPYGRPAVDAVRICSDAVRDRIARDYRFTNAEIQNARADNRPGRNDWIIGDATGRRGFSTEQFIFSCQVDFNTGRVRAVDVRPR
jgi:hypothetical protein